MLQKDYKHGAVKYIYGKIIKYFLLKGAINDLILI